MCGRFTLRTPAARLVELFDLDQTPELTPRYNIAPTQDVAVVRTGEDGRELAMLRWGLIPSWAKDPAIGNRMINARSETVAEKPSFRTALRRRRCLILADGFFEWRRSGKAKQPYLFHLAGGRPFALAGLWEHWRQGEVQINSCTICTTEANELVRDVHDRMPVILSPDVYTVWLDPQLQNPEPLLPLLRPYDAAAMTCYPVSRSVNNPANESSECIEEISLDE